MKNTSHFITRFSIFIFCISAGLWAKCQDYSSYKVKPAILFKAIPFDIKDVRLLKGSPFRKAMDINATYLSSLDPDRLLSRWRLNAGLKPKAPVYAGWEENSSHMLGHYLSACATQYAASGDTRFLNKVNYVVSELAIYQHARKTGYIGGIPNEDSIWHQVISGDIRSGGFDLNGGWVPWYMLHKVWAGLIDAYIYCNNRQAKEVVVKLSDWAYANFINMPDEQFQKMMICEFGGMNESLADVYALTGNKKYLDLSYKFYDRSIMDPLAARVDKLGGRHANTQIAKMIGAQRQYELSGNKREKTIAEFFFNAVVHDHSYVNGGNSNYEYFSQKGKLSGQLSTNTSETCNSYNMLKMDKHLFSWNPSVSLADYYERALYNHILASQNPETGMFCYYVALQSGKEKIYSTAYESFWCCVGTGIENHAKYGEAIYFKGNDGSLYVNLFIPSVLNWKEKGVSIRQDTKYPEQESTTIKVDPKKASTFAIHLRYPGWAKKGVVLKVNDQVVPVNVQPGNYITISRRWKKGDSIHLTVPMQLYTEPMPDDVNKLAVMYGPLLLSGELGKEKPGALDIPVLITNDKPVSEWIKQIPNQSLSFQTVNVGRPRDINLKPFYETYDQKYIVYWDLFTEQAWLGKKAAYEAEIRRQEEIERRTIDVVRVGEQQSEKDHNFQGDNTGVGENDSHKFRDAPNGGWFSYDLTCDPLQPVQLICTYNGSDGGKREFDILVNGVKIARESLKSEKPKTYIDHVFNLPPELTKGKLVITIRFQALPENIAGALFGCRLVKE